MSALMLIPKALLEQRSTCFRFHKLHTSIRFKSTSSSPTYNVMISISSQGLLLRNARKPRFLYLGEKTMISTSRNMSAYSQTTFPELMHDNGKIVDLQMTSLVTQNETHLKYSSTVETLDESNRERYTPQNNQQRALLAYTESILSDADKYPIGSLKIFHLEQLANCIDQWVSTGRHQFLGAQQAELLLKRLIMERGGGRSIVNREVDEKDIGRNGHEYRMNQNVSWSMYHLNSFIYYINALFTGKDFTDRIESIVSTFEEEYLDQLEVPYKSIISILCKCNTAHAVIAAEQILNKFEILLREKLDGKEYVHSNPPSTETYNNIISSWIGTGLISYPPFYQSSFHYHSHPPLNILLHMMAEFRGNPQSMARLRPDCITFNMTISSMRNIQLREYESQDSGNVSMDEQCFDILQSMLQLYKEGYVDCAPDVGTFLMVLRSIARRRHGVNAENLLNQMINLSNSGTYPYDITPRTEHFNIVLGIMAENDPVDDSTFYRAKVYMEQMEEFARKTLLATNHASLHPSQTTTIANEDKSSSVVRPDTVTYNTLISIASRAKKPQAAQDILDDMLKRSLHGDVSVKPDIFSFNTVLSAWSKSKSPTAGVKTAEILHRMQEMAEGGDESVKPDYVSLTTVINLLIASSRHAREAPIQAEAIISKMEESIDSNYRPDKVTYTSLIKCWGESGRREAASKAIEIIEILHRRYDEGHDKCKPDTMAYNVALNAIAKSNAHNSAELAEGLLQRMQERYNEGDEDLTPTTTTFSTVMLAWSRTSDPNAGKNSQKLLRMMHDLHNSGMKNILPNTIAYSTCILAWSKSRRKNAGNMAEDLLNRMDKYHQQGYIDMRPNFISFTNAMEAWISSRQPRFLEKVEDIFERMIERSRAGDFDAAPTTTTFNTVFKAIRHSQNQDKHHKAEELFSRMKEMHASGEDRVKPNIRTYNAFFSACASATDCTKTRLMAISHVLNRLQEMRDAGLKPDSYTWPAIWTACKNHLDPDKDISRINHVFELCVRDGAVNELVFDIMRNFLPQAFLQKKLGMTKNTSQISVDDLPSTWSSNVKIGKKTKKLVKGVSGP